MSDKMNILILSCGTRNKIVQYFKRELGDRGHIVAADCSKLAPALYDADKYIILPQISNDGYVERLLSICQENDIKAVLSLFDPELNILAEYQQDFLNIGTTPIVSDYKSVEMCFNKYDMYKFLHSNGIRTPRSYISMKEFMSDYESGIINFPVFVKPIRGSASINACKVSTADEFEFIFGRQKSMMVQEFMDGVEYGLDVYIDLISNEVVSIFAKQKLKMRAGETDKAVSVKDDKLFALIKELIKKTRLKGIIDIDIFKVDDEYYIGEINPRFGGGYPLAFECGVNVPRMIINNLNGKINPDEIGKYEENVYMMKYNEMMFQRNI